MKKIMIQGTMSNVGKSLIVAGLCRVFHQDGYRVAPFKSQNMALNSYITEDGLEMGRAQVVQAMACRRKPSALMNPILLKPTTDMGSQVIVMGEVQGNMRAMDYYKKKKEYLPVIKEAFEKLSAENDIIVIEGAGSPAELNLNSDDIVNMGLAKLVDAPVLLVGDIDRGGIFAQLIGTTDLLSKEEQNRVKGFIVNKFRGDLQLFKSGIDILEEKSGKTVLGTVPFLDIDIEGEDSLAQTEKQKPDGGNCLDIAVIQLPKISNYTDFDALSMEQSVSLRYVKTVGELGTPDVIILPGTKNTIADLKHINKNGLADAIKQKASAGTVVIGICGGYQMLGNVIKDEIGAESDREQISGLGLLPTVTEFSEEKERTLVTGNVCASEGLFKTLSSKELSGYEIHMGRTGLDPAFNSQKSSIDTKITITPFLRKNDGSCDGFIKDNIVGCYLHGIFDSDSFRQELLTILCNKKGIRYEKAEESYELYRDRQLDILADAIRQNLDMEKIYRILEEKS